MSFQQPLLEKPIKLHRHVVTVLIAGRGGLCRVVVSKYLLQCFTLLA